MKITLSYLLTICASLTVVSLANHQVIPFSAEITTFAEPSDSVCLFSNVPPGFVEFCRADMVVVFGSAEHVTGDCSLRIGGTIHARPFHTATNQGDPNGDGRVSIDDSRFMAGCLKGPCIKPQQQLKCVCSFDLDNDYDIDLMDFVLFQRLLH